MLNKVTIMGRLTKEPEVRYSQGTTPMAIARYSIAVNRRFKKDGEPDADFFNVVAFGKLGEFAEKFLTKGMQIVVVGHLQTGSYEKDGVKRYTTDIIAEEQIFTEKKSDDLKVEKPKVEGFVSVDNDFDNDDTPF